MTNDGASDVQGQDKGPLDDQAANASVAGIWKAFGDRYDLVRELGKGSSSTVYLAHDRQQGISVALKLLRAELAAAVSASRFLREVEIGRKLHHPRIVPILESGSAVGRPYYTMPFIGGFSLRERLQRDRQLSLDDALTIASQVAEVLDFAHANGIIHRDIKPGNILFGDDGAMVADFGIARAVTLAAGDSLTDSGLAVGTPAYMSPEQASGERHIDGRSDIYALGCVLYEMLAGEPPFTGPTPQAIVARHFKDAPRSLRIIRPAIPAGVEAVIERALAKVPADRFETAEKFIEALTAGRAATTDEPRTRGPVMRLARTRPVLALGVGLLTMITVASVVLVVSRTGWSGRPLQRVLQAAGFGNAPLDSAVYVVIPPDSTDATSTAATVGTLVRRSLAAWQDVIVAEPADVAQASMRSTRQHLSIEQAGQVARTLGAARFVRLRTVPSDDSLDVHATLVDSRSNVVLGAAIVRLASTLRNADSAIADLCDSLLLGEDAPGAMRKGGSRSTRSLDARRAFLRGHQALESGKFARADSLYWAATRIDPGYADALIWLALVRSWINLPDLPWKQLVEQAASAASRRASLSTTDSLVLASLASQLGNRFDLACASWGRLTTIDAHDFVAWYGLGACLRRDPGVVRDAASKSGWRFRANYEQALRAYERAFRIRPSLLHGLGGRSMADLQELFYTSSARTRSGRAFEADSLVFRGAPEWRHDSLTFTAVPRQQASLLALPAAVGAGVQYQRERLRVITQMWRAEFPRSPDAAEAVALALDMLGDASSLDTLRLARSLADGADDSLRLAASEVLLHVKFAFPADTTGLRAARRLADSLIAAYPPSARRQSALLGTLATLVGRAGVSAAYALAAGADQLPPGLAQSGPALLVFAALGGPADSLRLLEQRVESGVKALPQGNWESARATWLMRPGTLAFPEYQLSTLPTFTSPRASLIAASIRGDSAMVRRDIARIAEARRLFRAADITIDGILPEAAALATIGDLEGAMAWLDPPLSQMRFSASQDYASPARIGPLLRSAVLRATLANRTGDAASARLWARAVVVLWSGADEFLQPTVRTMEQYAR